MGFPKEALEAIQVNAQFVIELLIRNDAPADYGINALQWLEDHIEKSRAEFTEKQKDEMIGLAGSFLGECLCRAYDGQWTGYEDHPCVKVQEDLLVFPFSKVSKFVDEGPVDSFVSMYQVVPALIERSRRQKQEEPKNDQDG